MLTETVMAVVFAGHFGAAAALPFLLWQLVSRAQRSDADKFTQSAYT